MRRCATCNEPLAKYEFVCCATCDAAERERQRQERINLCQRMVVTSIKDKDFEMAQEWRKELEEEQH